MMLFGDYTVFSGVTYLGATVVSGPGSEEESFQCMVKLNNQSCTSTRIDLSIPVSSEGNVRLLKPSTNVVVEQFPLQRLSLFAQGDPETAERCCFAFTCSHSYIEESVVFKSHILRCDFPEGVPYIIDCCLQSIRRPHPQVWGNSSLSGAVQDIPFSVGLNFSEDDMSGRFRTSPNVNEAFIFRRNRRKGVGISVRQLEKGAFKIEKCVGLLISPGRNIQHNDMQLIELVSMRYSPNSGHYLIEGRWDPSEAWFDILDTERENDHLVNLTVAVDLMLADTDEPLRFVMDTKARMYPSCKKARYMCQKGHEEQFLVKRKVLDNGEVKYRVVKMIGETGAPTEVVKTPQEEDSAFRADASDGGTSSVNTGGLFGETSQMGAGPGSSTGMSCDHHKSKLSKSKDVPGKRKRKQETDEDEPQLKKRKIEEEMEQKENRIVNVTSTKTTAKEYLVEMPGKQKREPSALDISVTFDLMLVIMLLMLLFISFLFKLFR